MDKQKSYNILALRGADVDDMEYVRDFDLDESIAYTPQINEVMLDKIYKENVEFYRSKGLTEAKAVDKARKNKRDAKRNIDSLLSNMKKKH